MTNGSISLCNLGLSFDAKSGTTCHLCTPFVKEKHTSTYRQSRSDQFPDVTLDSGQQIRVHPGGGTDSSTDVYGESEAPAWNNSGDTITLLDQSGDGIDLEVYGSQSEEDAQASCGPR